MDLTTVLDLDPVIVLGIANEHLRHDCSSLQELSALCGVDGHQFEQKLVGIGYHYDPVSNQFKPVL